MKKIAILLACLLLTVLLLAACGKECTDHDFGDWKTKTAATCTEDGVEVRDCKVCTESQTRTVKALGHKAGAAATCSTAQTCSNAGCTYVFAEALSHTYSDNVVAPTKTTAGYTEHTCECGDSYTDTVVPFTGSVGLAYEIGSTGETCIITGIGTCTDTELYIPSVLDGYKVTAIGEEAFIDNEAITLVVIDSGVTEIGACAFDNCTNMKSFIFPDTLKIIREDAFCESGLVNVTLPDGLETIEDAAFECCDSLVSVVMTDSVTFLGEEALSDCEALESVTLSKNIPSLISMFTSCSSLRSIVIPASVTEIDGDTFRDCAALASITVEAGNPVYHSAGNCLIETATRTLIAGTLNSVIPADGSVTSIGEEAFSWRETLASIIIPEGVTEIGESAFHGCYQMDYVVLPASIEVIGPGAFFYTTTTYAVYYAGTAAQWNEIDLTYYNEGITNPPLYLYSEQAPTEEGNFWHYVDGVPTQW